MKILIIGHARSGKDTLAEIRAEHFGLKYESSSMFACKEFIFEKMKSLGRKHETIEQCFEQRKRQENRDLWFQWITEYNKDDRARLAKEMLASGADCYVGMRSLMEVIECKKQGVFDLIIWVEKGNRVPDEPLTSMGLRQHHADISITNTGTLEDFTERVIRIGKILFNSEEIKNKAWKYDSLNK